MIFQNREEAGRILAGKLTRYKSKDTIVLALPRGGVPVAKEIAQKLKLPLDVLIVRKLGAPQNRELAIGAIANNGLGYLDKLTIKQFRITREQINQIVLKEIAEIIRREKSYRGDKPKPVIRDKTIILVDDGIATGSSIIAAIRYIEKHKAKKIILAVPVCSKEVAKELTPIVSKFICLHIDEQFVSVGQFYQNFAQVTDNEVKTLLKKQEFT